MSKTCPNCGAQVPNERAFCTSCGASMATASATEENKSASTPNNTESNQVRVEEGVESVSPQRPRRGFPKWPLLALAAVAITVVALLALGSRGGQNTSSSSSEQPTSDQQSSSAQQQSSSSQLPANEHAWSGKSDGGKAVYLVSDEDAEFPHAVLAICGSDGKAEASYVGRWADPSSFSEKTEDLKGRGFITDTAEATMCIYLHESGSKDGSLSWDLGSGMGGKVTLEPCLREDALAKVKGAGVDVDARKAAHEPTESEALRSITSAWKGTDSTAGLTGYYAESDDGKMGMYVVTDTATGAVKDRFSGELALGTDFDGKSRFFCVLDTESYRFRITEYNYKKDNNSIDMAVYVGLNTATFMPCDVSEAVAAYQGKAATNQNNSSSSASTNQSEAAAYFTGKSKDGVSVFYCEQQSNDTTQGGILIYDPSKAKSDSTYGGEAYTGTVTSTKNKSNQEVFTVTDSKSGNKFSFTLLDSGAISIEGIGEIALTERTYDDWYSEYMTILENSVQTTTSSQES